MSESEFKSLRSGEKTEGDIHEDRKIVVEADRKSNLSAKNFLLNRFNEVINVPINGPDGEMNIQIKAKLTKKDLSKHKEIIDMVFYSKTDISEEDADRFGALFLADLTIDPELDIDFWLSPDVDAFLVSTLINTFVNNFMESVKKFRN